MFIEKISDFLPEYTSYDLGEFLQILDISNTQKFDIYKIEKDFLLTLLLIKFGEKYPDLIFKGGTCFNKIYFPYFRLSEDLDFVINTDLGHQERKTLLKQYENDFVEDLQILGLKLKDLRTKFDSYKLAMFTFEYNSVIDNSLQTVKIDISLKRSLEIVPIQGEIHSIFIHPVLEENIFGIHYMYCIDLKESVAEKLRASLTRKTPAIRDFFDIWYIKEYSDFDFRDSNFLSLLDMKLQEVDYTYSLEKNYDFLQKQIQTDLLPVLNTKHEFYFEDIYNFILNFKHSNYDTR